MSDHASQRSRPRQDPVSCESCRKKKLKCDRDMPCANCTNRGVTCEYQGRRPPISSTSTEFDEVGSLRRENAAIKARIDRLEELIYSESSPFDTEERPSKARRLVGSKSTKSLVSPVTTLSDSPHSETTKNYSRDVQWLEGVGTQENTRLPQLSTPYAVRMVPLEQIISKSTFQPNEERCILLPDEEAGMHLFDVYVEQLDPVQHLIHGPTVRQNVQQLYRKLRLGEHVEPNEAVLLLTTLTSISSYWGLSASTQSVFSSKQVAINVAVLWLRMALDVLEHVRRSASATMETVQAGIIILFLIYHIEGFSPKVRAIVYSTLAVAKDLGMHRTDDAAFLAPEQSQADIVDREMRRRVWWHLACTDWSLALAGGPHEGTYTVNPRHMRVKRPRNISDEDLATKPADFTRPLSEPTVMAYYLQRIKLGEICREVADMVWSTDADEVAMEDIYSTDRMFDTVLAELPHFLRLEKGHQDRFRDLDQAEPQILVQRYVVNLTIQSKRCKFHLPFLLRAAHDSSFSPSRDACLRSARAVMQIRKDLAIEDAHLWIASSRLVGILHLYFYATMVLVMDYCVNREAGCDLARKSEIHDACKALEEAKQECGAAGMFFDSLTAILRKHRIRLQSAEQVSDDLETGGVPSSAKADALALDMSSSFTGTAMDANDIGSFDFDELWQSYINLEASIDPQSWGALLSDIESLYQGVEH